MGSKPLVVVIASQKGGAAKTTLAAHFSVAAEEAGHGPVTAIDMDPQGTLLKWLSRRKSGVAIRNSQCGVKQLGERIQALGDRGGQRLVVIDTPPALTDQIAEIVGVADLVVVPIQPSYLDMEAAAETVRLLKARAKPFVFVVTRAKHNAKYTTQTVAKLSNHGPVATTLAHDRVDWQGSMIDGRTVMEAAPKSASAAEAREIWEYVAQRLGVAAPAAEEKEAVNA